MRKLITAMSISLGIGFVVALANAEDTTTNTKENTYESSQTKQLPGTSGTTDTTTTESARTTTDSKTCTDAQGVVHPMSDKQAYNDCMSAMSKQKKSGEMGGQMAPGARPSYSPES